MCEIIKENQELKENLINKQSEIDNLLIIHENLKEEKIKKEYKIEDLENQMKNLKETIVKNQLKIEDDNQKFQILIENQEINNKLVEDNASNLNKLHLDEILKNNENFNKKLKKLESEIIFEKKALQSKSSNYICDIEEITKKLGDQVTENRKLNEKLREHKVNLDDKCKKNELIVKDSNNLKLELEKSIIKLEFEELDKQAIMEKLNKFSDFELNIIILTNQNKELKKQNSELSIENENIIILKGIIENLKLVMSNKEVKIKEPEKKSKIPNPNSIKNKKENNKFEIQINSLSNDNSLYVKELEELKYKLSCFKEENERLAKNAAKNDILNNYNQLQNKYTNLKKKYTNLINLHGVTDKSLCKNLNNSDNLHEVLNNTSSQADDEVINSNVLLKKLISIKEGTTFIFSVFDSKRILRYDLEYRSFKLIEFADFAEFETNFYSQGSIFLNIADGLLIISGENHDLFYQYNYKKNCINRLNKLNDNHSYGGLIFNELENSLICLSGWHNRRVEKYLNLEISFNFIDKIEGSKKKFDVKNKNIWLNMPELITERSECPYIIINNIYLYAFFGFNCPKMKYLDTIERLNLEKQESWEIVKYSNEEHISSFRKSHSCIKINADELLFVGGYDGSNENPIENFSFYNSKTNKISTSQRVFPDIVKNHCYYFQKHVNFIPFIDEQNRHNYVGIDEKDNIHIVEVGELQYDIVRFED